MTTNVLDRPTSRQTFREDARLDFGVRVDTSAGVLRGVKILGLHSRNGREYTAQAVREAAGKYEGVPVFVDHPASERADLNNRSYRDRIGTIRNARFDGSALIADLHLNTSHPLYSQIVEDAQHNTRGVGLSHNVTGKSKREKGREIVEEIGEVFSVDLVIRPATTVSLFESVGSRSRESLDWSKMDARQFAESISDEPRIDADDARQFARWITEPVQQFVPAYIREGSK